QLLRQRARPGGGRRALVIAPGRAAARAGLIANQPAPISGAKSRVGGRVDRGRDAKGSMNDRISLGARLTELAAERGERPAITDDRRTVTWAELDRRTNRLARGLAAAGVKP